MLLFLLSNWILLQVWFIFGCLGQSPPWFGAGCCSFGSLRAYHPCQVWTVISCPTFSLSTVGEGKGPNTRFFFFWIAAALTVPTWYEISSPYLQWLYPIRKTISRRQLDSSWLSLAAPTNISYLIRINLSCFLLYSSLHESKKLRAKAINLLF